MKTWKTLSAPYTAANGFVVDPVGSQEGLLEMGRTLHNGLMVHHDMWASLCLRGQRQIVRILDQNGELIANSELEVRRGKLASMFVRGYNNQEFAPGDAAYDAVQAYLTAVNNKAIGLNLTLTGSSFAEGANELSPWQQAVKSAKAKFISPFLALVAGPDAIANDDDAVPTIDPNADRIENEITWTPLTAPFQGEHGVMVEPVGTQSGLRTLGETLENALSIFHEMHADTCRRGITQFVAIYTEADGLLAIGEVRPAFGRLHAVMCRARFDQEAPAIAKTALDQFVAAVNANRIKTNVEMRGRSFVTEGYVPPEGMADHDMAEYDDAMLTSTLFPGQRYAPEPEFDDEEGYDGAAFGEYATEAELNHDRGYDDDEETGHHADPDVPVETPMVWTALTDRFEASNGFVVEPVSDQETLRQMGNAFHNALETMHPHWAEMCANGWTQVVRILDPHGAFVANAEIMVCDGQARASFNRGPNNGPAPAMADEALNEWLKGVNDGTIELNGEIGDQGFKFEDPNPGMAM